MVGLAEGWAALRRRDGGVALAWDVEDFPSVWLWHEIASPGFPFYGRSSLVAIEPASSWPGNGLGGAIARGQALTLQPGHTRSTTVAVIPFEISGRALSGATSTVGSTSRHDDREASTARTRASRSPAAMLTGWNLFADDATFPAAVLLESALKRNSASMSDYCRRNGVSLAPHGKTTMSPELFALQLRDGAWAITAANVHQARVMRDSGVPRVLIANEVTAPGDIAWLGDARSTPASRSCATSTRSPGCTCCRRGSPDTASPVASAC